MFHDANDFKIDGGTFYAVNGNSTHITYNIQIVASENDQKSLLDDKQKWDTIISQLDVVIGKKNAIEGDPPADGDGVGKNPSPDDGNQMPDDTADAKRESQRQIQAKEIIVSTSVDNARKKLNRPTTIVFTLSIAAASTTERITVVWKVLTFPAQTRKRETLSWTDEFGFCTIFERDDGMIMPQLKVEVSLNHLAILKDQDGHELFHEDVIPTDLTVDDHIALAIENADDRQIGLCLIDRSREETDQFCPVIINSIKENHSVFVSSLPVMLQAYPIAGYRERQSIKDMSKLGRPLFVNKQGNPEPIDIRALKSSTVFRLYTNQGGKVILEK